MPLKCFEAVTAVLTAAFSASVMASMVSVLFLVRALLYAGTVVMTSRAAFSAWAGGCRVVSESQLSRRGMGAYITVFIALAESDTSAALIPTDAL
jgi:hypothetical protein